MVGVARGDRALGDMVQDDEAYDGMDHDDDADDDPNDGPCIDELENVLQDELGGDMARVELVHEEHMVHGRDHGGVEGDEELGDMVLGDTALGDTAQGDMVLDDEVQAKYGEELESHNW